MKKLLVIVLLLFVSVPVLARPAAPDLDARTNLWWTNFSRQLAVSLDSPIDNIKAAALQQVVYVSTFYKDRLTEADLVPALLDVYELETDERFRTMSLVALHALANPATMEYLRKQVRTESSKRIKRLTIAALNDYYAHR